MKMTCKQIEIESLCIFQRHPLNRNWFC